MNLAGLPIVLVTGGTAGIGGHVTRTLAQAGFEVWFVGRSQARGKALEDELSSRGQVGRYVPATLECQDDVARLAQTVLTLLDGRGLSALVNNLGGLFATEQHTLDGVERTFAYNFIHPVLLSVLLLPALERAQGRIIQMSTGYHHLVRLTRRDLTGRRWDCAMNVYGRAKLLSVQVGELLGYQWAQRGVGLHFADPGMAETPLTKSMRHKDFPWYGRFLSPVVHRIQPFMSLDWCASSTLALLQRSTLPAASGVYVLPGPIRLAHGLVGFHPRRAREAWPLVLRWFATPWREVVAQAVGELKSATR